MNERNTMPAVELAGRLDEHARRIRNPGLARTLGEDLEMAANTLRRWRVAMRLVADSTSDKKARETLLVALGEGD